MIGWQVDCKECGKRYVKRQNLKIHKFLDDESIAMNGKRCRAMHNLKIYKWLDDNFYAMNEEWISGQGPLKKITDDQMTKMVYYLP